MLQFLLHPPVAGVLGLSGAEIGFMFAAAGMLFGGIMGIAGMYFHHQRQKLWHETARIALERGQPVPPPPGDDPHERNADREDLHGHDLRGGLVLVAVGIGLFFFLKLVTSPGNNGVAFLGAIPGFIGIALLLNHWLVARSRQNKNDSKSAQP